MERKQVILVLGAGASWDYGFPLGGGLLAQIKALGNDTAASAHRLNVDERTLSTFLKAFEQSQSLSIDAFLARRGEFAEVGKRAIAAIILGCEDLDRLKGHWYQWLIKYLYLAPWDDLDLEWLSIVTFNYDRSLEMFLLQTMMANYDRTEADVLAKLRSLKVLHVYGQLGPLTGPGQIPYQTSNGSNLDLIVQAASSLQVIPEGREEDAILAPIRGCIASASHLAFLGFGFDRQNLRRLGFPAIWPISKPVGGTCIGMTGVEKNIAAHMVMGSDSAFQNSTPGGWVDGTCTDYLRSTGLLEHVLDGWPGLA